MRELVENLTQPNRKKKIALLDRTGKVPTPKVWKTLSLTIVSNNLRTCTKDLSNTGDGLYRRRLQKTRGEFTKR